jgi:uncharacterized protein
VNIPGPAGALQAQLTISTRTASAPAAPWAILCHPHPQYGGNMHDMVLASLEAALLAAGVSCLRFNFRGVGGSEGAYGGGAGEVEDLVAVVNWLQREHSPTQLWLGGYSFGAFVVWQAISRLDPARVLLVAPPVGMMSFEPLAATAAVDIFAGDQDDFVDLQQLASLRGTRQHLLPGADHFFQGQLDELQQRISSVLTATGSQGTSD